MVLERARERRVAVRSRDSRAGELRVGLLEGLPQGLTGVVDDVCDFGVSDIVDYVNDCSRLEVYDTLERWLGS